MSHNGQEQEFIFNETISNAILFFLLIVRLVDQNLAVWIFGVSIPSSFSFWYSGMVYILTASIVWLNRHRLSLLNIDRPFIITMILGGVLYYFFLPQDIGALVGITTGFIFWAYINNMFYFKNTVSYSPKIGLLVLISVLLALVPVFIYTPTLKTFLNVQFIVVTFFGLLQAQLAGIIFEEVLFRGALWAYLRTLGLSEPSVFCLQAFLFWISHHHFLLRDNPYTFWVALPIVSLLLGLIAWQSKSLTPSTISHFLYNFTGHLLLKIF